jgi:dUTP pyrophosphatase
MEVKIKKLIPEAVIPSYAKEGDAGLDLTATHVGHDEYGNVVYGTGVSIEIPKGYVGLIFPRSSVAKKDLLLSNSVGVIDSGYRGEILFKFKSNTQNKLLKYIRGLLKKFDVIYSIHENTIFSSASIYEAGDRIGQLVIIPYPQIELKEVEMLSESERGGGGYGSTGV